MKLAFSDAERGNVDGADPTGLRRLIPEMEGGRAREIGGHLSRAQRKQRLRDTRLHGVHIQGIFRTDGPIMQLRPKVGQRSCREFRSGIPAALVI